MWRNLSPTIYRKRLIIEGTPTVPVNRVVINRYLRDLSPLLRMTLVMGRSPVATRATGCPATRTGRNRARTCTTGVSRSRS